MSVTPRISMKMLNSGEETNKEAPPWSAKFPSLRQCGVTNEARPPHSSLDKAFERNKWKKYYNNTPNIFPAFYLSGVAICLLCSCNAVLSTLRIARCIALGNLIIFWISLQQIRCKCSAENALKPQEPFGKFYIHTSASYFNANVPAARLFLSTGNDTHRDPPNLTHQTPLCISDRLHSLDKWPAAVRATFFPVGWDLLQRFSSFISQLDMDHMGTFLKPALQSQKASSCLEDVHG
ncbi:hypothetical protein T10_11056 [Trichinella papuae]|uniref:Uncharacterized protein n=1 Tax=Trichinella papuae TaxID=268474 RepID=A0A0V1N336_9BILA|nr:hypothetical protein T10_11056 [Trichinella papuae]